MSPAGPEIKNDSAGKDQQKFTGPTDIKGFMYGGE
jgi:hypothetical protein